MLPEKNSVLSSLIFNLFLIIHDLMSEMQELSEVRTSSKESTSKVQ